jgi:ArsR family transcriptional regulator, lead/cadmium/zinc/bismuth-responsive transcriptional repressor
VRSVTDDEIESMADLFSLASDGTRLRILLALLEGEECVCALADGMDVTVSAVSHQLRLLRSGGLVRKRRDGRHAYYSLADDHVSTLLKMGLEHVRE